MFCMSSLQTDLPEAAQVRAVLQVGSVTFDRQGIANHANDLASNIAGNLERSLTSLGVDILLGTGRFVDAHTVEYKKPGRVDVGGTVTAENVIIASGSVPFVPQGIPIDGKTVITSDHALKLDWIPDWIAIIGCARVACASTRRIADTLHKDMPASSSATHLCYSCGCECAESLSFIYTPVWYLTCRSGYIGLEFSDVYTALGSEVTFVEAMPNIMPGFDTEIAKMVRIMPAEGKVCSASMHPLFAPLGVADFWVTCSTCDRCQLRLQAWSTKPGCSASALCRHRHRNRGCRQSGS